MNRITQEAYKRQAVVKTAQRKGKTYASRMYSVSLSSVKRWCRRYDGSWQSLKEKSHRPNSHPHQHTAREEDMIREAVRQSYFRYGWEGAYMAAKEGGYSRSYSGFVYLPLKGSDCAEASRKSQTYARVTVGIPRFLFREKKCR